MHRRQKQEARSQTQIEVEAPKLFVFNKSAINKKNYRTNKLSSVVTLDNLNILHHQISVSLLNDGSPDTKNSYLQRQIYK